LQVFLISQIRKTDEKSEKSERGEKAQNFLWYSNAVWKR
jgi:hypothetical protein